MHTLREASFSDSDAIRDLYLSAFPEEEGDSVAQLAIDLLDNQENSGAFAIVAELEGLLAGHIGFSPVGLEGSETWSGYILSPLAVAPDSRKRRLGAALVEGGKDRLAAMGVNLLFVYGDPAYYGRFGFDPVLAARYSAPYPLEYPFGWQAFALKDDARDGEGGTLTCVPALRHPQLW